MSNLLVPEGDDPMVQRLLRFPSGLQKGGSAGEPEILATYRMRSGEASFAFCRTGLLLEPEGASRLVPFSEIEEAGYYDVEMLRRAKAAEREGRSDPLSIRLRSGEVIDLPMDVRDDGMPDLLNIAGLIHQQTIIHRPSEGSRSE